MSPALIKLLFLAALLVIWTLFGKRIVAMFLVRSASQGALNHVGKKAIESQPDFVNLARDEFPKFSNAAGIDELKNPLLASGFDYVGTFNVDKMPGVKVVVLAKPDDYVTAHIYEHPRAGIWIELVTRYQDGSSHSLTTLPATGIQLPPFVQTIRAPKAPAPVLVKMLMSGRHAGEMKRVGVSEAVQEFEQNYAKYILWQKNKGMTTAEMAQIVQKWAEQKLPSQVHSARA
ncbi:MAG TPA: hypothetical protein VFI82_15215 [Terriglobales bacterium]|jgi:hypothetical protein|nr:hypothetical protein [Terriglobales bacterium]